MNFYALKAEFKEFLLSQGISSSKLNEKGQDSLNLFTYGAEFKKFIDEEYEINLENEYNELAELFEADVQDGKFVVDESKTNDKEANFMVDMVNGLLEDKDFIKNIDEYAANDNEEGSMLDMLSDLFKDKGITNKTAEDEELKNTASSPTGGSSAPMGSSGGTQGPGSNFQPQNHVPQADTPKDYSQMNKSELEEAKNSKQTDISENTQNLSDTISQNEESVATAKEEYDAAIKEDNIDPALLASRDSNLESITQTDNTINELTSTLSDLEGQISSVESQIGSVDSSISALNSALSSLGSAPADDPEAQAQVAQKRAAINSQLTSLNTQKADLETQKADLETQKADTETSLNENTTLLQQLETEKTNIETQILETCNETTRAALENYNKARTEATTAIQTAKDTLSVAQKELSEIEKHLSTANAKSLEKEHSYKGKADAFSENEGFTLIKGEGDTNLSYSVIAPNNLDPNEEAPVIVYLHGAGGNERTLYNQIMQEYNLDEGFNGYIICPTVNGGWHTDKAAQNVDQILNTFAETHKIDANNIVVVGHSLGGTGALNMASNEVFQDDEGYKFKKAAALTGYPDKQQDYDIPIAIYADSGSRSMLKDHNLNADSEDLYVDWSGRAHGQIDNFAFTEDLDNDGRADLLEWLFDED